MLPLHPPLLVAECFGTLEALYPDRIDLGVARVGGLKKRTTAAMGIPGGRPPPEEFLRHVQELIGYFDLTPEPVAGDGEPDADPAGWDGPVRAIAAEGHRPPVWMVGSTAISALVAGTLGLPYALDHHQRPTLTDAAVTAYHESFRPSPGLPRPRVMLIVSVIAAVTDARAVEMAQSSRRLAGRLGGVGTVGSPPASAGPDGDIVGSVSTVRERLRELLDRTGADELIVTTRVPDHADRRRSYLLLTSSRS